MVDGWLDFGSPGGLHGVIVSSAGQEGRGKHASTFLDFIRKYDICIQKILIINGNTTRHPLSSYLNP